MYELAMHECMLSIAEAALAYYAMVEPCSARHWNWYRTYMALIGRPQ
jgi:hypothetical protein